jgi:hypothetical protein
LHSTHACFIFQIAMQEPEHNADDVAASERARQRAKRAQKPHGKKAKQD